MGRVLVLGRTEATLSLPELQEQVCLQAHERRGKKTHKTKHKALQIPPFPSDPERTVQFQAIREARERYWASIKGKGTGSRQRRFVLKLDIKLFSRKTQLSAFKK